MDEILARLEKASGSMASSLRGRYELDSQRVDMLSGALVPSLRTAAVRIAGRVDRCAAALAPAVRLAEVRAGAALSELSSKLSLLSPYGVLERGYSLTTDADGNVLRSAAAAKKGDLIETRLASGKIASIVQ